MTDLVSQSTVIRTLIINGEDVAQLRRPQLRAFCKRYGLKIAPDATHSTMLHALREFEAYKTLKVKHDLIKQ